MGKNIQFYFRLINFPRLDHRMVENHILACRSCLAVRRQELRAFLLHRLPFEESELPARSRSFAAARTPPFPRFGSHRAIWWFLRSLILAPPCPTDRVCSLR